MEHPVFTLKAGDTSVIQYQNDGVDITIEPGVKSGRATIFDKDVWIYCISKLMQAIYENKPIDKTIRFTAYDFFVTTNREIGGNTYKQLEQALYRLSGTRITLRKKSEKEYHAKGIGLIDGWDVKETQKHSEIIEMIEVTLPDWLYTSITEAKVLKINPNYFRIRKAMDRRMYEIARKHCGNQKEFIIGLNKLHIKVGSKQDLRRFRADIKKLAEQCENAEIDWNNLPADKQTESNDFRFPDYYIRYDSTTDQVIITSRDNSWPEKLQNIKKNMGDKRDRHVENKELKRVIEKTTDENGRIKIKTQYELFDES